MLNTAVSVTSTDISFGEQMKKHSSISSGYWQDFSCSKARTAPPAELCLEQSSLLLAVLLYTYTNRRMLICLWEFPGTLGASWAELEGQTSSSIGQYRASNVYCKDLVEAWSYFRYRFQICCCCAGVTLVV